MTAEPWPHGWRAGLKPIGYPRIGDLPATGLRGGVPVMAVQQSASVHYSFEPIDNPQPDLDDAGTKGVLTEMVRELSGDEHAVAFWHGEGWVVIAPRRVLSGDRVHSTEGLALKAALDHLADKEAPCSPR
jgi:hypothetical protein